MTIWPTEKLGEICEKEVKKKVKEFESSRSGRGYRINCDVSERKRFVDMILQIVHNSDYIRKLYQIFEIAYWADNIPYEIYKLCFKYGKLKQWIRLLENTEESNFYD